MSDDLKQVQLQPNTVDASPTKTFFMSMLTRDIELNDAIMDLLDNCIDGVHRKKHDDDSGDNIKSYDGFFSEITIDKNQFVLKDNCGGIPLDVAKNYAFKLGRDNQNTVDKNLETVGMYGIGMKRAIFKMGNAAQITSHHHRDIFKVEIPSNWITEPGWFFNYTTISKDDVKDMVEQEGTYIKITGLHRPISDQFANESSFIKNLAIAIRQHYGYIIQQGFKIKLNGEDIPPLELNILTDEGDKKKAIKPYVYKETIDGIDVEVIVGFYRPLASEEEIEQELTGTYAKSATENAGITVICNDRIVLYCDKSYITGWGDTPIPKYHTQFISISGVVHFRSKTPINLPVTTTKRGLDTSSNVYGKVKERIKDGLRYFTNFTNVWKTPSEERTKLFESTIKFNALAPGQTKAEFVSLTIQKNAENDAQFQLPDLPKPTKIERSDITIKFTREKVQVEAIRTYFLGGSRKSASEIGGWCFDEIYSQVD
jgi:hypothetical protein